jgi:DNA polymerase
MATDGYRQLLEASIRHLEALRSEDVRFIAADPSLLSALAEKPAPARVARPVTVPPSAASPSLPTAPAATRPTPAAIAEAAAPGHPPFPDLSSAPATTDAKRVGLDALRARALACVQCPNLVSNRKHVVVGVGNVDAPILFVGEAPGADEDRIGEPFVGNAGELLTKIILAMGLSRDRVYIANVLKCRPDTPGQAYGNRKPTAPEMAACVPFLYEQIQWIRPRAIVALGGTAIEGLLGRTGLYISRMRGKWVDFQGIPVMPTFHPSYLLRPENAAEKRRVWEDMLAVMERVGLPISEKQRGYFQKPG